MLEAVRNNKQAQHSGKFLIKPVLHKILMFCSNWLIMNPSSLVIDTVAAWWLVSCNYPDINIKTLLWSTSSAPWSAQQHCITYITCHQSAGPYLRLKITGVTTDLITLSHCDTQHEALCDLDTGLPDPRLRGGGGQGHQDWQRCHWVLRRMTIE